MIQEKSKVKNLSQYDKMTKTPIPKLILKLSVPTVISMLVTSIYNLADTAFVGKLGTSASGAVGIVFGFMAILQAFGFMLGNGSGNNLARALGSKDSEKANRYASTAFFLALGIGLLLEIFGLIYIKKLIFLLGSTETIYPYAKSYITWILLAAPFSISSFVLNCLLRYEGKAAVSMIGLLTGSILNIICDPILMFVFDMGISGAGLSTAFSQFVSFCILLSMFLRKKTQITISIKSFSYRDGVISNTVLTGFPSLIRQGLGSISTMLLNVQAGLYGDAAIAGMSIASRITMFIFSVCIGLGQGFQPVSGYNYGAKKFNRVKTSYFVTLLFASVFMGTLCIFCLIFSEQLITLFRNDPNVIAVGNRAVKLQCIMLFLQPICITTEMFMQTTGQKLSASILATCKSGLFLIPALLILTKLRGLSGVQEAQPLAFALSVIVSIPFAITSLKKLPKEQS